MPRENKSEIRSKTYRKIILDEELKVKDMLDHEYIDKNGFFIQSKRDYYYKHIYPPPPKPGFIRSLLASVGKSGTSIRLPPGHRCVSVLKFLYSKKTFERVFEQILVDMREEHLEALSKEHAWHARWIHTRGLLSLLTTMIFHAFTTSGRTVAKIWKLTP